MRSPTFTLVNPSPTGVVTGPFSATLFFLIESSSSCGSGVPCFSSAETPASNGSHCDVDAGRLEDARDGGRHFRADAVAGNERDRMPHAARVPSRASQKSSARPARMMGAMTAVSACGS